MNSPTSDDGAQPEPSISEAKPYKTPREASANSSRSIFRSPKAWIFGVASMLLIVSLASYRWYSSTQLKTQGVSPDIIQYVEDFGGGGRAEPPEPDEWDREGASASAS